MTRETPSNGTPLQDAAAPVRRPGAPRAGMPSRSAVLGDIVSILMRAPKHRTMPLESLGHFVLPAIMHDQFRIARIRKTGSAVAAPAGFAVWASVSEAVDQRLRAAKQLPVTLAYEEWRSGPILWLIDLVAPSAIAADMLKEIEEKVGRGKPVFMHVVSADGARQTTTVSDLANSLKTIPA